MGRSQTPDRKSASSSRSHSSSPRARSFSRCPCWPASPWKTPSQPSTALKWPWERSPRHSTKTAAAGTVLGQAPAAGTHVRHGTPVSLTVSKGPQPIPVPDVRGQEQEAAVKAIEAAGPEGRSRAGHRHRPERPEGRRGQPGAGVRQSDARPAVTLTISEGPQAREGAELHRQAGQRCPRSAGEARLRSPRQQHPGRLLRHSPGPGSGGHRGARGIASSRSPWSRPVHGVWPAPAGPGTCRARRTLGVSAARLGAAPL